MGTFKFGSQVAVSLYCRTKKAFDFDLPEGWGNSLQCQHVHQLCVVNCMPSTTTTMLPEALLPTPPRRSPFQAVSQVLFLKSYAYTFDSGFFAASVLILTAGAMIEVYIADCLGELKLGSGTSLLIFTNIVSYLPASIGRTASDAASTGNWLGLGGILATFVLLIGGIIYVQVRAEPG